MNPFKVLGVGPRATPAEILQAAARALRERKHPAREVAQAQKDLLDPARRPVLTFLYALETPPAWQAADAGGGFLAPFASERLTLFDEEP